MTDEKKNIFDKIVDSLTDRDEKEAAAKAAADKQAAAISASVKAAADKAAAEKAAAEKVAADKAAAVKAAADKVAAEKAAALKAAADKASAERIAAVKASAERAAAEKAAAEKAAPKKGTVMVRSLRVRKEHNTDSLMVAGLVNGNEVMIYETWTDGKDTWARIGPDQWAAMIYNGETYIKVVA